MSQLEKELEVPFDPFDVVSLVKGGFFRNLLADRRAQKAAREKFEKMLVSYELMLRDERYSKILSEVEEVLGDQLIELVRHAKKCSHCASKAERVELLQQIVKRPIEAVWSENQRQRLAPEETEVVDAGV